MNCITRLPWRASSAHFELVSGLFQHVLDAASRRVDQVDLYVAVDNVRAWKFYRKFEFTSYGVMPRALRLDGVDYDTLMMTRKFR